jgi:BlaR1 peptidase M56/Sulfatase-modifying factor enzyme 1
MNYLFEFTVCTALFYGLYLLIFSRLTFIRLNRIYLLSSLVISLCVPLISYQWEETVLINEPTAETSANDISTPLLLQKNLSQFDKISTKEKPFDWVILLQILYVLGIIFMFGKLLFFMIKILKMSRLRNNKDYISTKGVFANSSFFNLIFIDDSTLSEPEIEQIMAHERWHIRLYHSYDLLFVEILKVVFWFNPILWFLQQSLSQVHEYEADTRMIQTYNPQTYATLLLKLANSTSRFSPIHQFSRKPLTDRIHFLFTKQKSTPMKRLAYLSILPILGVMFMAFSVEKVVKYRVAENPDEKYFKIIKKPDAQVNNEVLVKENKVVSNLVYGENRIALTMNPNKISMDAIASASQYFKRFGFNLEVISFAYHDSSKQLDKLEISLTEDKENNKNYRSKKTDIKSTLPAKFTFDLKKMKGKRLDDIITILADRSTGEHFVASLAPPPPPPLPPNKAKIRIINATGLIMDSETLLPVGNVSLYNADNKLLGKTDASGFFNIEFNVEKEGEIYFKLSTKKEGYSNFVQNEHWGDLEGNLNATYYFGLRKKNSEAKSFSKLVIDKKYATYDEVKEGFSAMKEEFSFDKKIETVKKNNDQFFFKIDNDFYLINDSGWIKLNSENDKIIVNNDKVFAAKEINLYVKRSCVTGMSPITSKNASFEVQDKCLPLKLPVKVGMRKPEKSNSIVPIYTDNEVNKFVNMYVLPSGNDQLTFEGRNIGKGKFLSEVVTQKDWQTFLEYINNDNYFSAKFRKDMIPDYWNEIKVKSEKRPVTFVSWNQAVEYCKWQSQMFSFDFQNNKKPNYQQIISSNTKVKLAYNCRLPTEIEWNKLGKKYPHIQGFYYLLETTSI